MKRLVIVGGGFAGVWAALAAAQQRADARPADADATITLINRDPWLTIRPRLYEAALEDVRVPLAAVLDPVGVELVQADVRLIDTEARRLTLDGAEQTISYDCLVLASGTPSTLHNRPRVRRR
jgi:NADH:ubiquinone reductase (H+-translocating)